MSREPFEITVSEVSDMEARVVVHYAGEASELRGLLRGPYCATAHTLPTEYPFRQTMSTDSAEAVIPDPCLWSEELPHIYVVDLEAVHDNDVIESYHGQVGLRFTGHSR